MLLQVFLNNMNNDFIAGFILPFLIAASAALLPMFVLEWLIRQPFVQPYLITYHGNGSSSCRFNNNNKPKSRRKELEYIALCDVPLLALVGATVLHCLNLDTFKGENVFNTSSFPVWYVALYQFIMYYYTSDFISYGMHYILHENDFLWKYVHAKHHKEHTPTALSAVYATFAEELFVGAFSQVITACIVKPHAIIFYICLWCIISNTGYLHCGIDHPIINFIFGGIMPFSTSCRLHDRHHKIAGRKTQDLGGKTWIWDYIFGTLSSSSPSS